MSKFRDIKVNVPTPEISEKVQNAFFKDGVRWSGGGNTADFLCSKYLFVDKRGILYKTESGLDFFKGEPETEVPYQSILDPYYDVKIAWANGDAIQRKQLKFTDLGKLVLGEWEDFTPIDYLNLNSGEEWRVKPKTKTIKQWERKAFNPYIDMVVVVVTSRDRNHISLNNDLPMWIGEAYEAEYEVPYE